VGVWDGMPAHSPRDAVLEAAAAAKNAGADVIVTVGGGSLTDGAKVVRIALQAEATTSEELGKYCFKGDVSAVKDTKLIPQVSIPTTLSAGEFAPYAGCTDPATKVKETYVWLDALPKAIVLDPWLAQQTPEWLFLSTGLRAVDHCVECLLDIQQLEGLNSMIKLAVARSKNNRLTLQLLTSRVCTSKIVSLYTAGAINYKAIIPAAATLAKSALSYHGAHRELLDDTERWQPCTEAKMLGGDPHVYDPALAHTPEQIWAAKYNKMFMRQVRAHEKNSRCCKCLNQNLCKSATVSFQLQGETKPVAELRARYQRKTTEEEPEQPLAVEEDNDSQLEELDDGDDDEEDEDDLPAGDASPEADNEALMRALHGWDDGDSGDDKCEEGGGTDCCSDVDIDDDQDDVAELDWCSLSGNPYSDGLAAAALALLVRGLRNAKAEPEDVSGRSDCQLGIFQSVQACQSGPKMGASHAIGHILGPVFEVPHGYTSCVALPGVLRWNAEDEASLKRQKLVVEAFERAGAAEGSASAGDCVANLVKELGLPGSLADVGVARDQLEECARRTMHDPLVPTNPRKIDGWE
ncbi:FUM7, partial [Symbiodinium sp. KB8]